MDGSGRNRIALVGVVSWSDGGLSTNEFALLNKPAGPGLTDYDQAGQQESGLP